MKAVEQELRSFLTSHIDVVTPLYRQMCDAVWEASLTGKEDDFTRAAEAETNLRNVYRDAESLAKLLRWKDSGLMSDPLLERQLTLLIHAHLENQMDRALLEEIVKKQLEVERFFSTHRAEVRGKKVSDNEIKQILRKNTDPKERREAWEGSKSVGARVADRVLELVRLRNRVARGLGFGDFYAFKLHIRELAEDQLFEICSKFKALSDEPFRELRRQMDDQLAERFRIPVAELRPWHYQDPFFQEAPSMDKVSLDPLFEGKDLRDITSRFFEGVGLSVDDILARSDLFERPGKNQHAYCLDMDRSGDVRVLCNIRPTTQWMATMLHEFGHAVYDKYLDDRLPFLLRTPSHTFTTEAVAMLMGRQAHEAPWLRDSLSLSGDEVRRIDRPARNELRSGMLISTRWMLTMIHFERELYRNPEQELNQLWWDMVEEFQMIRRPEDRDAPDWASKIHIACYPVYYHNYLLGEFMASQLRHWINARILSGDADTMAGHPNVGSFLREKIFSPGASLRWDALLKAATSESLNPGYFVDEFVTWDVGGNLGS